jgi:uncharacterized protein (DUF302 family)
MSMRNIAIAGAALALALGCEREAYDEPEMVEEDTVEEETRFEQAPDTQRQPQQGQRAQQPGQPQYGEQQQPPGQQGQLGQPTGQQPGMGGEPGQEPGQIVTMQSNQSFERTLSQLTREMRQNDLDVVAQIRYDEPTRRRALRELEQGAQAQRGQQQRGQAGTQGPQSQQAQIGDVRVVLFRHTTQEAHAIETQGPEAILQAPRELLVYERGDDVVVAYRTPPELEAPGAQPPTSELLSRVVRDVTQPQQPRAEAPGQQEPQEPQASLEPQELEAGTELEDEEG